MGHTNKCRLIGDIGGTNARFRVLRNEEPSQSTVLPVADFKTVTDALRAASERLSAQHADSIALAIAGVVDNGQASLTNGSWVLKTDEVSAQFDGAVVEFYNDVQAAALGIGPCAKNVKISIRGDHLNFNQPILLMMLGTGLGVSCLLPEPPGPYAVATEAGHMTLASTSTQQDQIVAALRTKFGTASAEMVLSGQGLTNLFAVMTGNTCVPPAEIIDRALDGAQPYRDVMDQFCEILGGVAGDLILSHGAWGGLCLSGGVGRRILPFLDVPRFWSALHTKARFTEKLASVPVFLLDTDDLALQGLAGQT